ncbi:OLC1v1028459C1 [Oldenlandia corymbosa var. corymbosa]|uniref:OLC1v1028459C1 n=1 Tax=Oldenlandia corymbosa var. corymbosa TaxID=529605 RepID=A0AAV1CDK3_OLDCO|nr:OLC1v1028459C1 [Oldenlandia corymbosa var. corymbosa]
MSVAAGDEEQDAVLSDVEEDDPVSINIQSPAPEDVSIGKVRELLAELDRERKEREAAEKAKSELQVSFNRLKALAHDAIRKRDESSKQRDEALREKEEALKSVERVSSELTEAAKGKDEMLKQLEEMTRSKDSSRSEIETAASMLVSGIEKISGKVSNFKNFMAGGLPRSQKYTGLPAVAYGVIKRTNEIVEELLRQIELTTKSRNETRELMEQRNYEIAIEVSQLEATISGLREEVSRKSLEIEKLEKSIGENDEKLGEWQEKQMALENEELGLRNLISEQDEKLRSMETKMSVQRSLLIEQLNYVTKVHREISNVVKVVDASKYSELSESMFMAKETDAEENIKASLAGMESIYELSQFVVEKTRELIEERNREVRSRNEMVSQLVKEKEQIGSLLRSALSRRTSADLSSKTNELFKVAENGLKAAGIDYKFSNHLGEGKVNKETISVDAEEDEVYALAGALENIIKQSQVEIIELKHSLDDLRAESNALKQQVETQKEELNHWRQRVDELEEKERVANANVEALMLDIAAAEEEITRWKVAAQQEADAGKAVEEDYSRQVK